MSEFAIAFTRASAPETAVHDLADRVEATLGPAAAIAGGLLFATAAAGREGPAVGRLLGERWPEAELAGTSFEGVVMAGELSRDRPALLLLAWAAPAQDSSRTPGAFAFEEGERDVGRMAHAILEAAGRSVLGPNDLVLLFPDAHSATPIESLVRELEPLLGQASIAGAAASGLDGQPALSWMGREDLEGSLLGLVIPGPTPSARGLRVRAAGATRPATPWLAVTQSRGHWVDRLEDERALDRLRRQLDLGPRARIEPHLERLLVRLRRLPASSNASFPSEFADCFDERFVVGVDDRGGSISLPVPVARGDQLAFAFPDAGVARDSLRSAIGELVPGSGLLHFGCRARDARLHGDEDLEPALVAHHARDRWTLGTVGPFQLGPDAAGRTRLLVHATVVAALGPS